MNPLSRRSFLAASLAAVPATVFLGPVVLAKTEADRSKATAENAKLRAQVEALSANTASGGGVNAKMMLDPSTREPTVPMEEVFSFDRHHAFCRVDTNPAAFLMPTYGLGDVTIEPNQFYMNMEATDIEEYRVSTLEDGSRSCRMRGFLSCATEVAQGTVTLGSRSATEPASYVIEAIDGGTGGGAAGDSFTFTVNFDPATAPVNHSIFGPKAKFTGDMVSGEITIVDPDHLG